MQTEKNIRSDHALEIVLGAVLRTGVIAAAAIVFLGGILDLVRCCGNLPTFLQYHGEPAHLNSVRGIVLAAFQFDGRGLIQLGLLVLIATPIARVAVSLFVFVRRRDYLYVWISLIVLALLTIGFVGTGM